MNNQMNLITASELAKLLNISRITLNRRIRRGEIKPTAVVHREYYPLYLFNLDDFTLFDTKNDNQYCENMN